jgi:biopolymer transport protein ExbD
VISVTSADSQEAADIANAIAVAYVKQRSDDQKQEITSDLAELSAPVDAQYHIVEQAAAKLAKIRARDNVNDPHPDTAGTPVKPADPDYEAAKVNYINQKVILDMAKQAYETKKMELQISLTPAKIWERAEPATLPDSAASPASAAGTPSPTPDYAGQVVIDIRADGTFSMDKKQMDPTALKARLKELASKNPGQAVIIRGDENVNYQLVANVLDICKEAGISNVAFSTAAGK